MDPYPGCTRAQVLAIKALRELPGKKVTLSRVMGTGHAVVAVSDRRAGGPTRFRHVWITPSGTIQRPRIA